MTLLRNALLIILVPLLLGVGVMFFISHKAVVEKANADYAEAAPVSARFSRFKANDTDRLLVLWKLRFAKETGSRPSFGVWHLQPFGRVTFEGGKR